MMTTGPPVAQPARQTTPHRARLVLRDHRAEPDGDDGRDGEQRPSRLHAATDSPTTKRHSDDDVQQRDRQPRQPQEDTCHARPWNARGEQQERQGEQPNIDGKRHPHVLSLHLTPDFIKPIGVRNALTGADLKVSPGVCWVDG